MDALGNLSYVLAILFFVVALVYSSVGLGGGSSYIALMAIFGVSAAEIPMISLVLNLFVTSVGSFNFIKNKHAKIRLILPFLITSIPMAYLGGALQLPKQIFYWILLISLGFVAARIYLWENLALKIQLGERSRLLISLAAGSVLGLVAGIVGIGGGIYLVPLIIVLGLGSEKEAAACGAIFIWLNSCSGLISRLQYNSIDLVNYLILIMAVLLGGVLGSYLGAYKLAPKRMEKILGVIILVAIIFVARKTLDY